MGEQRNRADRQPAQPNHELLGGFSKPRASLVRRPILGIRHIGQAATPSGRVKTPLAVPRAGDWGPAEDVYFGDQKPARPSAMRRTLAVLASAIQIVAGTGFVSS